MRPLRVVIVEDDEHDLLLMQEQLRHYGFAVDAVWVRDAAGLQHALESASCDVVLADNRLPHFSGRDALRLVRSSQFDVPFILVTATLGDERAVEMIHLGADDYVLKERMGRLGYAVDRVLRDYSDRRNRIREQQALAALQRRFQQTFEHAPIGIVHTVDDGRFVMVNDFFCSMVGYTREELERMTFVDLTHPEDRELSLRGWSAITEGRDVYRAEKRYVRKDGSLVWIDLTATAVRNSAGAFEYALGMVQEITARKTAEKKVRLQGVLLDAVEQAVIATDPRGYITYWNRFARDLYGWHESEVLGQHIMEITTPEISETEGRVILEQLMRGESWDGELLVHRRDGTLFPAMVLNSPILNGDGSLAGMVGISFDLTAQKKAEAALQRSEQRYRDILEGVVEIIIGVSAEATVSSVNRAFEIATGWRREEIIGRKLWDLMPESDVDSACERLAQRLRGENLTTLDGRMMRKNGSSILIEGVAYVGRDVQGEPEVFYFLRDVTDRARAEEERARLERQLRLVLESTDEGIYAVDAGGYCTLMNRAAAQFLGFSSEEILGRRIHDVIHFAHPDGRPYERTDCAVDRTLRRGTTERVRDEVFWRRDGTCIPVEFASAPVLEEGAIIGAVITFTDISQRQMLEAQLAKANRLNGLGRIAATIAHEFNNVLMGIQPFAEILRLEAGASERMLRSVDRITTSIRRGKRVTSEILQFTRQSAPARKPLDVASWLNDLAAEARHFVGESIDLVAQADAGLTILGDNAALQQVFMNMIINARDALDGRGAIVITACPSEGSVFPFGVVERGDTFAHFTVSDNGPGIPPETMQHIFEPLFTTKQSGTGLGLALAHHIVQQHGGAIFVESTEGIGTSFHLFLPLSEEVVQPKTRASHTRPSHVRSLVLVEDDATVAAGFVNLLALHDVQVQVAVTGGDALDTIERTRPDAVVLDISLPDIDGTRVYEAIARRWPTLPVIFATGHAESSRLHPYTTRPNVGHVLKPYQLTTLYDALAGVAEN